jgi:hypothetical protein
MSDQMERLLREYSERTKPPRDDPAAAWRALSARLDSPLLTRGALMGVIAVFLGVCALGQAHLRTTPAASIRSTGAGGSEGTSGTPGTGGAGAPADDA